MMNKRSLRLIVGLVFALIGTVSQASFIVAPNANETTPGSGQTFMLGNNSDTANVLQWVLPASEFSLVSSGDSITSIGFRPTSISGDLSYSQWDLQLSSAVNPAPTLNTIFANNIGADVVTVYSGTLDILASSLTVGEFFEIDFITPYVYSGDDLLMTLTWQGPSSNNLGIDANSVSDGLGNTNFAFQVPATSGQINFFNYPITRFGISPVPVPAAIWLFGSGLIGLIGVARRKKS